MKYLELFEYFHLKDVKRNKNSSRLQNLHLGMPVTWKDSSGKRTGIFREYSVDSYEIYINEIIDGVPHRSIENVPYNNLTFDLDRKINLNKKRKTINFSNVINKVKKYM